MGEFSVLRRRRWRCGGREEPFVCSPTTSSPSSSSPSSSSSSSTYMSHSAQHHAYCSLPKCCIILCFQVGYFVCSPPTPPLQASQSCPESLEMQSHILLKTLLPSCHIVCAGKRLVEKVRGETLPPPPHLTLHWLASALSLNRAPNSSAIHKEVSNLLFPCQTSTGLARFLRARTATVFDTYCH